MAYTWGYVIPPDVYGMLTDLGYGGEWLQGTDGNYYASEMNQETIDFLTGLGLMPILEPIESNLWPYGG